MRRRAHRPESREETTETTETDERRETREGEKERREKKRKVFHHNIGNEGAWRSNTLRSSHKLLKTVRNRKQATWLRRARRTKITSTGKEKGNGMRRRRLENADGLVEGNTSLRFSYARARARIGRRWCFSTLRRSVETWTQTRSFMFLFVFLSPWNILTLTRCSIFFFFFCFALFIVAWPSS